MVEGGYTPRLPTPRCITYTYSRKYALRSLQYLVMDSQRVRIEIGFKIVHDTDNLYSEPQLADLNVFTNLSAICPAVHHAQLSRRRVSSSRQSALI